MTQTVAIDLGKRCSGLAVFNVEGTLEFATEVTAAPEAMASALVRRALDTGVIDLAAPLHVAWERMRDYAAKGRRKGNLQQLRDLATECRQGFRLNHGEVRFFEYTADTWKGRVPKPVCVRRIANIVTVEEICNVVILGKESYDAIGIGLYHVGRAGRGMIRK